MAKLFSHWKLHLEISAIGPLCAVSAGTMASGKDRVSWTLERACFSGLDNSTWTGLLLPTRSMCGQTLKAIGRRLSESRMRENLMSGSMWQGMETRRSWFNPRRHSLTLPADRVNALSTPTQPDRFRCGPWRQFGRIVISGRLILTASAAGESSR